MHVVRSGRQGIKPELQNLTEGDLSLALPSGRSPPPYDHRRGCAPASMCVGSVCWLVPRLIGPIGRLLNTLFLPMLRPRVLRIGCITLRQLPWTLWKLVCV